MRNILNKWGLATLFGILTLLTLAFIISEPTTVKASPAPNTASKIWVTGPVLDQEDTPQCVAYSLAGILEADPLSFRHIPSPQLIYDGAQARDAWKGTAHDGTSIEAGIAYLTEYGYITGATYTTSAQKARDFILDYGPVEVESVWTLDMSSPSASGVVTPTSVTIGRHAYMCYGYYAPTDSFWCQNSWGTTFGNGGRFSMSSTSMQALFTYYSGEAAYIQKSPSSWRQSWFFNQ